MLSVDSKYMREWWLLTLMEECQCNLTRDALTFSIHWEGSKYLGLPVGCPWSYLLELPKCPGGSMHTLMSINRTANGFFWRKQCVIVRSHKCQVREPQCPGSWYHSFRLGQIWKRRHAWWHCLMSWTTQVTRVFLWAWDSEELCKRLKLNSSRWAMVGYKYFKTTNMIQKANWSTLMPPRAPDGMAHRWE